MTLTTQFMTMLSMISMGVLFGAGLDTYQRFLKRPKRKGWIVFINDILFWLLQGLAIFYVLFLVNEGELRFYIFLALLCGFAAYQSLMKNVYVRLLEMIISLVISIYRFLLKLGHILIVAPLQMLFTMIITLLITIGKGLLVLLTSILKLLLLIVKIVFLPVKWVGQILWRLLPNRLKKSVEKLYNKLEGYLQTIKEYVKKQIAKWKKKE
ncbi:spore cortex biosynthesis protein YabQ [Cytobacillus purgationiresistens]|uniref:Spore cortex biosynthesis protein YabQ n=1 Tax=Cytobacillus purgationiresistens TaxID=863449 RepID=A0ABU0AP75_9BACI|nr:spore cortex biosynthesis protein YabQ [Cytobacillus purgationiresistens]MDQ0273089.1 spore cortex biosynthesis protein YabQ [Cytobacillus purgationiresistens]